MSTVQNARKRHGNYFIDLEMGADQNWRVTAVTHAYKGSSLLPPAFCYPDQTTAERYAKMAIDAQLHSR